MRPGENYGSARKNVMEASSREMDSFGWIRSCVSWRSRQAFFNMNVIEIGFEKFEDEPFKVFKITDLADRSLDQIPSVA